MAFYLNTGYIKKPPERKPHDGVPYTRIGFVTEYDDTSPAEAVIYPAENKRLILVEPNVMIVITGYNLKNDTQVIFRKILRSNGIPAQGDYGCCPSIIVANTIRLQSVDLPCWKLTNKSPIFVIKTPGTYEVDVIGANSNGDPDAVITAMAFPMQEVNCFEDCCKEEEGDNTPTPTPTPDPDPNTPIPC